MKNKVFVTERKEHGAIERLGKEGVFMKRLINGQFYLVIIDGVLKETRV